MLNSCDDFALINILVIVKRILNLVQLIGPLLSIVAMVILIINFITNPDEKKNVKKVSNCIIALLMTFFVPVIVDVTMGLLGETTKFSLCWRNAEVRLGDAEYIETEGTGERSMFVIGSDEYEPGEATSDGSDGNNNSSEITQIVYIGDSRTVQMYAYLNNDWSSANYSVGGVHEKGSDIYVAQGSMGLDWLKSTGIPAAQKYFKKGTAVAILMGVNDLGNADKYISYINSNVSSWTSNGSKLYFVSVNPCNGGYNNLNTKIKDFNSKVKSGLSSKVKWIDTNSYLVSDGYKTTDGLHYDSSTSKKIHDYIKNKV